MTQNQIAYAKMVNDALYQRHQAHEQRRNNIAALAETARANKAREFIDTGQLRVAERNASTNEANAATNLMNASTNAVNASTRKAELRQTKLRDQQTFLNNMAHMAMQGQYWHDSLVQNAKLASDANAVSIANATLGGITNVIGRLGPALVTASARPAGAGKSVLNNGNFGYQPTVSGPVQYETTLPGQYVLRPHDNGTTSVWRIG